MLEEKLERNDSVRQPGVWTSNAVDGDFHNLAEGPVFCFNVLYSFDECILSSEQKTDISDTSHHMLHCTTVVFTCVKCGAMHCWIV